MAGSTTLLAEVMARHRISQRELARRTGLALQTIADAHSGRSVGMMDTWIRIAKAVPCRVSEINPSVAQNLDGVAV